eukprot:6190430-Pleurochrysis_carterae.AAC.3
MAAHVSVRAHRSRIPTSKRRQARRDRARRCRTADWIRRALRSRSASCASLVPERTPISRRTASSSTDGLSPSSRATEGSPSPILTTKVAHCRLCSAYEASVRSSLSTCPPDGNRNVCCCVGQPRLRANATLSCPTVSAVYTRTATASAETAFFAVPAVGSGTTNSCNSRGPASMLKRDR